MPRFGRLRIDHLAAPIRVDLAERGFHFLKHHHFIRRLGDLERLGQQIGMGHAVGQVGWKTPGWRYYLIEPSK
jgi:hypothetical protein